MLGGSPPTVKLGTGSDVAHFTSRAHVGADPFVRPNEARVDFMQKAAGFPSEEASVLLRRFHRIVELKELLNARHFQGVPHSLRYSDKPQTTLRILPCDIGADQGADSGGVGIRDFREVENGASATGRNARLSGRRRRWAEREDHQESECVAQVGFRAGL
jgi:hypothetical protein